MCNNCGKWNHFASVCQSKAINNIETARQDEESTEFYVGTIEGNINEDAEWTMPILTSGINVTYKLDTGAQVNILPQKMYHTLPKKPDYAKLKRS